MKKRILKKLIPALFLVMACAFSMTACQSPEDTENDLMQGVTPGRSVIVEENGVAFWGWGPYLCSGLVGDDGKIYDFVIEFQGKSDINAVAAADGYLYAACEDGFYRYDMEDLEKGGVVVPLHLSDQDIDNGFEIYQDAAYYVYGYTLYSVPLEGSDDGSEKTEILSEVTDFDVTADGIYYTTRSGEIFLSSMDGSSMERVVQTGESCKFQIAGDSIYYKYGEDGKLYCHSLKDGTDEVIEGIEPLNPYADFWVNNKYLIYESEAYDRYIVDLEIGESAKAETDCLFPYKNEGFLKDNMLYGYNDSTGVLSQYDLTKNTLQTDEMQTIMQNLTQQSDAQNAAGNSAATANEDSATSNGIDINQGLEKIIAAQAGNSFDELKSNSYSITLPTNINWTYQANSTDSVSIYYAPAKEAGFGGHVVTIKAYDIMDSSYTDLPNWKAAGATDDLWYVAIFPTDVQFDPDDPTQREEYQKLADHFAEIGNRDKPDNNPFTVF